MHIYLLLIYLILKLFFPKNIRRFKMSNFFEKYHQLIHNILKNGQAISLSVIRDLTNNDEDINIKNN